jgi:hypothetical protein
MNKLIILSALLSVPALADLESVNIPSGQIHVPLGFDSNDKQVEVIVTGAVPDTCHKRPQGKVSIDGNKIKITMKADKVSGHGVYCIKAVVPYMVSVPLGQLSEGLYQVSAGKDEQKSYNLVVGTPGSASIDNFTYANVMNVKTAENGNIVLSGEHPSNCMDIERVEMIANENLDTFSILPIVTKTAEECNLVMTPFSKEIPAPAKTASDVVFHIRRLDGTAINFRW